MKKKIKIGIGIAAAAVAIPTAVICYIGFAEAMRTERKKPLIVPLSE